MISFICVLLLVICLTKGLYFRRTPFPPTLFDFFIYDILNMDTAMLINTCVGGWAKGHSFGAYLLG